MLLNPNDYKYKYFHQPRGKEGLSGAIYLGIPRKSDSCRILVKSNSAGAAINEFLGCNIGQRIGVNTPKAWLFKPEKARINARINFSQAVGIEYLEGLDEQNVNPYETEETTIQTLQAKLLHIMISDTDRYSIGRFNGNIYTFDFAEGMYETLLGSQVMDFFQEKPAENGFSHWERIIFEQEIIPRRNMWEFIHKAIKKEGLPKEMVYSVYSDLRDGMMKAYAENGFEDLIQSIEGVYSVYAAKYARDLIKSTYNMIIDFPEIEGAYYRTKDGVTVLKSEKMQ